jgi:hypothetical protein
MSYMKLMYSVNNPNIIKIAENCGIDRIWIDLEINGKEKRQASFNTLISRHSIEDVKIARSVINIAELIVRINPMSPNTKEEIDTVIKYGADMIMLPFFSNKEEVELFLNYVDGRVKTNLLIETPEAVDNIDEILSLDGINEVHVGLNDLHLGYGMKFLFEVVANGTVEFLCKKFYEKGIPYGFGGITKLNQGILPAEFVIGEHYRLGSTRAILSRNFFDANKYKTLNDKKELLKIEEDFKKGLQEIRAYEDHIRNEKVDFFQDNKGKVQEIVNREVNQREKN